MEWKAIDVDAVDKEQRCRCFRWMDKHKCERASERTNEMREDDDEQNLNFYYLIILSHIL